MDSKEQVTKSKNDGRVAAGKGLAEWNHKNKENLLKNKEQVKPSDETSEPSSAQEPTGEASSYTLYIAAASVLVVAWILWTQKKETPTVQSSPPLSKPAIELAMF